MSVVLKEGMIGEEIEHRAWVRKQWEPFPTLKRFLVDHYPEEWVEIQTCGMKFRWWESKDRPGRFKHQPLSCHNVPFCIVCVRRAKHRRVKAALDKFARCTPAGQEPRFIHIVQTAPTYENGGGWGYPASTNVHAFGKIVWKTLVELYGEGIGAVFSYQDFGEEAFAKRHPHMDLTLNGWTLREGKAVHTPRYDLTGDGRARWDETVVKYARSLALDAHRGNVDVSPVFVGAESYYKVLAYQMRELVDLRKIEYSRKEQTVHYQSYKNNTRTRFEVWEFKSGLIEYAQRLGPWNGKEGGGQDLHRS